MGKHDRTNEKVKEEVDVKQRKTNKKKKHTGLKIFIDVGVKKVYKALTFLW